MKSWVKIGAICECHGEGRGNLFVVKDVWVASNASRGDAVWLYDPARKYDLGWKNISGCHRSAKCRIAEHAANPEKKKEPKVKTPAAIISEFMAAEARFLTEFGWLPHVTPDNGGTEVRFKCPKTGDMLSRTRAVQRQKAASKVPA